ncbi:Shikimate O-hydroxycinnamoyltransferase [Camellia lanceoleosa]|uniref:Shikimate O-hydroxycinnamoyltransferase n=1 Tax=Camellia lanceoleosa TaxID=1840588 RepID=A0ACC0IZM0_9ERIC|nr:Shikimate O-hydroxycinnamoyltransferase [Camellia lanceoleosa]
MGVKGEFKVKVSKKEVVAAVLPMQEHWLPQSNLDLLLPPLDVGVFFCYNKPITDSSLTFGCMVSVLKKAMAQALVSYYAFAGEMVENSVGEPELLCNNRGVDFIEAFADVKLQDLNLYNPDDTIEGKLVPKKMRGVLCVQATELVCGGLVVACTFDHRVADAYSANMFLVSWAEMAHSKPLSLLPSFRRSLISPRRPGFYNPSFDDMYVPVSALPPPKHEHPNADHLISRIYYVQADELSRLQSLAENSGIGHKTTKLEAFSASLWKMVAAGEVEGDKICRMGIVVDGRVRMGGGETDRLKLMNTYFGNVLSIPYGEKRADELRERPLSWVADRVHECLESAVTKDHFLDLIDWVEAHRPEPALAKIYASGGEEDAGPAFVVSSGQRFPGSKVDFGWGKPMLGSYHFPWEGEAGYVMPMPSPLGNGDWVVYMHLLKSQMELIETQAAHVFRPLTFDYLLNLV